MMAINKKHSSEQFLPVFPKINTQIDYWLLSECIHCKSMFDCRYYIEMIEWQRCQDTSVEHPFHGNSPDWHSWSCFEWHGLLSANFCQTVMIGIFEEVAFATKRKVHTILLWKQFHHISSACYNRRPWILLHHMTYGGWWNPMALLRLPLANVPHFDRHYFMCDLAVSLFE